MSKQLITSWSYSNWKMWKSCAYRFKQIKLLGVKEPEGPALEKGNKIHKLAEHYLKGDIKAVPKELKLLKPEYENLRKFKPIVEEFWGITEKWQPSPYKSWCVMKMDAAVPPGKKTGGILIVQDLKTGKQYPDHEEQGELYAAIGARRFVDAKGVEIEFWYSDTGETSMFEYTRKDVDKLVKKWTKRAGEMIAETKFLPNPSLDACKYCTLRDDRKGSCKAWRTL